VHANVVKVSMSLQAAAAFNYPLFSCANSAHSSANHSLRARARAHARVERRIGPLWTTEEKFPECYSTVGLEHSCTPSTWIRQIYSIYYTSISA